MKPEDLAKKKAKGRKRALRQLEQERKPTTAVKKPSTKPTRKERVPNFGKPVTLVLPALGNRMRGPTSPPTISRHVIDAMQRKHVEELAQQAIKVAGIMAADQMTKEKEDDA